MNFSIITRLAARVFQLNNVLVMTAAAKFMPRYAALDIGSNSIRMLAAEVGPEDQFVPLVMSRRVVRLGENVFREGEAQSPRRWIWHVRCWRTMAAEYQADSGRSGGTRRRHRGAARRDQSGRVPGPRHANPGTARRSDFPGLEEARLDSFGRAGPLAAPGSAAC